MKDNEVPEIAKKNVQISFHLDKKQMLVTFLNFCQKVGASTDIQCPYPDKSYFFFFIITVEKKISRQQKYLLHG